MQIFSEYTFSPEFSFYSLKALKKMTKDEQLEDE